MENQWLIIDGDDTLWENNTYFERAIEDFIDLLAHGSMSRAEVREALDEIERVNIAVHGYGAAAFVASLHECYEKLHAVGAPAEEAARIDAMGDRILSQPIELIAGVQDTLAYLRPRHRMAILTKGEPAEQTAKVDRSGLAQYFEDVVIVPEKTVGTYVEVVDKLGADRTETWMIGNSPRSDINPAVAAGLRAVFVPHAETWVLEHEAIEAADDAVLVLEAFPDLMRHF